MRCEVEVNGRMRQVVVQREGDEFVVSVDGRELRVDAVRVNALTWSLLVDGEVRLKPGEVRLKPDATKKGATTRSYEVAVVPNGTPGQHLVRVGTTQVSVAPNGRRSRRPGALATGRSSGPQRVVAPMPGKVVRVLVAPGDAVRARQALVVVEAMKMENELRAVEDGVVTELLVRAGQSVDSGALVAIVTPGGTP